MIAFIELTTVSPKNRDLVSREGDLPILIPISRIGGIVPPHGDELRVSVEDSWIKNESGGNVWFVRETYNEIREKLASLVRTM